MKTLSNDLDVTVSTLGMTIGYATTEIFADGTRVFMGRSYIDDNTVPITVNLNDIAVQNRLKYDYLKLADSGTVVSIPSRAITPTDLTYFVPGQISNYKVVLTDSSTTPVSTSTNINVLTGYDYPNEYITPNVEYPEENDTSTARIMQGCYWIAPYPDSVGQFTNKLLPHYPAIMTSKYGMGLQIQARRNEPYALTTRLTSSTGGFKVGRPQVDRTAAMTFQSMTNILPYLVLESDSDTSVYLKERDKTDSLVWGNYNTTTYFYGEVKVLSVTVESYKKHLLESTVTYTRDNSYEMETYLDAYQTAAIAQLDHNSQYYNINEWDIIMIVDKPNRVVYTTPDLTNMLGPAIMMNEYHNFYLTLYVGDPLSQNTEDYVTVNFTNNPILQKTVITSFSGRCPVAILDACPARYYLAWNDRYGDIQSLSFEGKYVYSEDIETDEIKDYKLRRKVSQKSLLPKWKLNTKWITEDIYPMYESIFVSPYLLLYDTKTNRSWNVIVTDSEYTEKNHKNDKMINLEINLEAIQTQNYIY